MRFVIREKNIVLAVHTFVIGCCAASVIQHAFACGTDNSAFPSSLRIWLVALQLAETWTSILYETLGKYQYFLSQKVNSSCSFLYFKVLCIMLL